MSNNLLPRTDDTVMSPWLKDKKRKRSITPKNMKSIKCGFSDLSQKFVQMLNLKNKNPNIGNIEMQKKTGKYLCGIKIKLYTSATA
jgi:hypothetical protein